MTRGIDMKSLARYDENLGSPVFALTATVQGAETKEILATTPYGYRVIQCTGTMLTAGTTSDTAVLQRKRGGTAAAITDTAALDVFADTDQFTFTQYTDATWSVSPGDTLQLTTAGGAATDTVFVVVWCVREDA